MQSIPQAKRLISHDFERRGKSNTIRETHQILGDYLIFFKYLLHFFNITPHCAKILTFLQKEINPSRMFFSRIEPMFYRTNFVFADNYLDIGKGCHVNAHLAKKMG